MLCGVFRTKERKVIGVVLGLIVIIIIWIVFGNISREGKYNEQAVMAENYLNSGSYKQAVKAYQDAMLAKGSDQEELSIGLARAYVGLIEYDKALEILNASYQKKATIKIKKMIEEINTDKTDYEFLQSISAADVYFSNKEYDKAITEYEEAKLIKSKDTTSYQGIAKSYIEMKKYDEAKEEVTEGIEITKSEKLKELLIKIDYYLHKEEYDALVTQADDYIVQENYEDGIAKYKEAINLVPTEPAAYSALAQFYIDKENYDEAILLLKEAVSQSKNSGLKKMLLNTAELKVTKEQKEAILSDLFKALKEKDIDEILSIMRRDEFRTLTKLKAKVFYETGEGDTAKNAGLMVNKNYGLYYGNIINGVKKGVGIYFVRTKNSYGSGYYYYEGEWNNNIPNGAGKTVEVRMLKNDDSGVYEEITVTIGSFYNALENGTMEKHFYKNGKETGQVSYTAKKGVPMPADGSDLAGATKAYSVGYLIRDGEKTKEEYLVEANSMFGVKPYIMDKMK